MPTTATYHARKGQLETYFGRTAVDAWTALTSETPVSRIRRTVRAGRDSMRATMLGWLPGDLDGMTVLDAGCGTGALSVEAARRGASVTAVDISASLIDVAVDRAPADLDRGRIDFSVGDMTDPSLGRFDYIVAMDSLIHYPLPDALRMITALAARAERGVVFTFAPRTPALAAMHAVGRLFPKSDRAPSIEPIAPHKLDAAIRGETALADFRIGRTERISNGFYMSQALELSREGHRS